jgi:hypothetical protein
VGEPPPDWTGGGKEAIARLPQGSGVRYVYESGRIGSGGRQIPMGRWRSHGRTALFGTFGTPIEIVRETWFHGC